MATRPAEQIEKIDHEVDLSDPDRETYAGMRLTVDELFELPNDGHKYEVIDGVVMMSPRASGPHQHTAISIFRQLDSYNLANPIGEVFLDFEVRLGQRTSGRDILYAPDVVFVRSDRQIDTKKYVDGAPDLAVEVISPGSRRIDTVTKRNDYERFGVREYWIIDPARNAMTFLRLMDGKYVEVAPDGDKFASEAVPGFALDLVPVRATFKLW